ncbi:MAG: nodulation efficiency protein D [Sulfurimonadaceae bacterium]|jgi:membrane protein implicated in regulation of membrane protease activity|nr:nodulation efficiency protein D [Sulfurimonadaceae bacterium]
MDTLILEPLSPLVLLGIGVALIALETFILSFVAIWFGIGFVIVGFITIFFGFDDGIWQIVTVAVLALLMIGALRGKSMDKFLEPAEKEIQEDFFNESGYGVIKDGMVYYKATFWTIAHNGSDIYEEGEEVFVESTHKGQATIRKTNS